MHKYGQQVPLARGLRREQTEAERLLWSRLRNKQLCQVKFRRQQPIGSYIVDFVSFDTMLIIEIDGGQHDEQSNRAKDELRTGYLEDRGYKVIRFWNNDVLRNLDGVLIRIEGALG
ncbi:MAG: endonuclease domain-containing protein [Dehalococcoidales bacterium]|nr:endonuclease domain-containing protein [Dehalococcoidales bacterium]